MRSYIIRKFHSLNDIRFGSISFEMRGIYDALYTLAGALDADGLFIESGRVLTNEEIAFRLRTDTKTITKAINELKKSRIIHVNGKGPQIIDWKHEQIDLNVKRERDRGYQAKHRARQAESDTVRPDSDVSGLVSDIETQTQTQTRVLLLLSKPAREKVEANHPKWIDEAIEIANTKHLDNPEQYAAGILRNWLTEGRKAPRKPVEAKKKTASKPDQPKLSGDALKVAREKAAKAAKELLK